MYMMYMYVHACLWKHMHRGLCLTTVIDTNHSSTLFNETGFLKLSCSGIQSLPSEVKITGRLSWALGNYVGSGDPRHKCDHSSSQLVKGLKALDFDWQRKPWWNDFVEPLTDGFSNTEEWFVLVTENQQRFNIWVLWKLWPWTNYRTVYKNLIKSLHHWLDELFQELNWRGWREGSTVEDTSYSSEDPGGIPGIHLAAHNQL